MLQRLYFICHLRRAVTPSLGGGSVMNVWYVAGNPGSWPSFLGKGM